MPDQDYWIVNWKVGSLVRWSGAGSVRNLAFLDLIVNKSQKPIKAFLLDGNQSNRASQNSLMECDARSGLLDCWLKGWQSGSLVWSRFSQKPRISGSNSKKSQKPIKAFLLDGNQSKLIQLSLTCADPSPLLSMSLLLGLPNAQPNAQTGSSPRQEIYQGFSGIV